MFSILRLLLPLAEEQILCQRGHAEDQEDEEKCPAPSPTSSHRRPCIRSFLAPRTADRLFVAAVTSSALSGANYVRPFRRMAVKMPESTRCFAAHMPLRQISTSSSCRGLKRNPSFITRDACQSSGGAVHILENLLTLLAFDNGNCGKVIQWRFRWLHETPVFEELAVCGAALSCSPQKSTPLTAHAISRPVVPQL